MDVQPLFDMLELWPMAKSNYMALDNLQFREVNHSAPSITLMFNPERIRSTAAKVDSASICNRPCFLCKENRPMAQRAIAWRNYDVLVNPYPIFKHHLTIVDRTHCAQDIGGRAGDMYALALELRDYSIFFNGPLSGASAPDHFHFQAGDGMFAPSPLQREVDANPQTLIFEDDELGSIAASEATGRLIYHLMPKNETAAVKLGSKLCSMRILHRNMINVIARARPEGSAGPAVDMYLVQRRLFRPWQYSAEGNDRILLSPAAVEVGGIYVLPRREDFDRITSEQAVSIMKQVCFEHDSQLYRLD